MEFLGVRADYAFKKVFGSEQSKTILTCFLNATIYAGRDEIVVMKVICFNRQKNCSQDLMGVEC